MRAPGLWGTAMFQQICPEHGIETKTERVLAIERTPGSGVFVVTTEANPDLSLSGAELS